MLSEIGLGAFIVAWFGSLELRIKNHVNKDRFNDLKNQTCRIETKVDKILFRLDGKDGD